jgi:hypothetical protein
LVRITQSIPDLKYWPSGHGAMDSAQLWLQHSSASHKQRLASARVQLRNSMLIPAAAHSHRLRRVCTQGACIDRSG